MLLFALFEGEKKKKILKMASRGEGFSMCDRVT